MLERSRLHKVLDDPAIRLCLVQGPSGSGKTTLLRGWEPSNRQASIIWVPLSGGVETLSTFWQHVGHSTSRLGGLTPEMIADLEEMMKVTADPVNLAENLLAGAGPVVLVIDAYEHLGDAMSDVDADLLRLLRTAKNLRVIITTRAPTSLEEAPLDGIGLARTITAKDLAFTTSEMAQLLEARTGITDPRLVAAVARATHGFCSSVRAAVLMLAQLGRVPRLGSVEWNLVLGARMESLLPTPRMAQFVTDTSVPPYFDLDLGSRLSGAKDTVRILETLERNGFGRWIPFSEGESVFQYVDAIRDTFRARAQSDPRRFRNACVLSATWLMENEEVVEQALLFAIEGRDYTLADRIYLDVLASNPESYASDRFLRTLRKVPEAALRENPVLAFGLALALLASPSQRTRGARAAELAAAATPHHGYSDPVFDAFALAAVRAVSLRLAGDFEASVLTAQAAFDILDVDAIGPEPHLRERCGLLLRQLSYSLFVGGELDEAVTTINMSVSLCQEERSQEYSIIHAAGYSAVAGDVVHATALLDSIHHSSWSAELHDSSMNAPGLLAEGWRCLDAFDFRSAFDILPHAAPFMQTAELWPLLSSVSVAAKLGLGQGLAEARRVARDLEGVPIPPGIGDNLATTHLRSMLALAFLSGGDHRSAAHVLAPVAVESTHVAGARIALELARENDREAFRLARTLRESDGHTSRTRAETKLWGAAAALRIGDEESAWTWLSGAASIWESRGARAHVAFLSPALRRRLVEFAHHHGARNLEDFLATPSPTVPNSGRYARLTKRELVVLRLLGQHDSVKEIAAALVVSSNTVKSQLRSVYFKLGVTNRRAALRAAGDLRLLDDDAGRSPRREPACVGHGSGAPGAGT